MELDGHVFIKKDLNKFSKIVQQQLQCILATCEGVSYTEIIKDYSFGVVVIENGTKVIGVHLSNADMMLTILDPSLSLLVEDRFALNKCLLDKSLQIIGSEKLPYIEVVNAVTPQHVMLYKINKKEKVV